MIILYLKDIIPLVQFYVTSQTTYSSFLRGDKTSFFMLYSLLEDRKQKAMVINLVYRACFDGASRGNPGEAGAGAVIYDEEGKAVWEFSRALGKKTNNEAEYSALIFLLEEIKARNLKYVQISGDSKLVVNQVNGLWKVNKPHLKELFLKAKELKKQTESELQWVSRDLNAHADALSNRAFEKKDEYGHLAVFDSSDLEKITDQIYIAHGTEDYAVDLLHRNCSCPFFQRKKDCKHLRAALSLEFR